MVVIGNNYRVSELELYDKFLVSYQNNISNLLKKLRVSRKKEAKLRKENKNLNIENNYFRDEIHRLENSEERVRDLLSEKSRRVDFLEGIKSNISYIIQYRLKYNLDNDNIFVTDWYNSEIEALKFVNSDMIDFTIEKSYQKRLWSSESDDDF